MQMNPIVLRKGDPKLIRNIATYTDTALTAGIMVIIMCTAVSLVATEAAVKWTKERRRCLEKRKKFL